jgi:hypothetical protein
VRPGVTTTNAAFDTFLKKDSRFWSHESRSKHLTED